MISSAILMVNDGSLLLQVMGCLLETRGYRLHLTDSPEQALILLNTRRVQLLVVKINGSQIDRLSLLYMVKELNTNVRLIIIADKAHLPPEVFEIEADDYILLPCRMAEIWRRLSIYLEPSWGKSAFSRGKDLAHLVNRQILKRLRLVFQEMQVQAVAVAQDLRLLKNNLSSQAEDETARVLQEAWNKAQTLVGMAEQGFHRLINAGEAKESPGIIDLEEYAAPATAKKAWEEF